MPPTPNKLDINISVCHNFIKKFSFFVEIRSLDSEMQTLVYENYNKFISATDTIRKVTDTQNSCEFVKMNPQLSQEIRFQRV